MIQFMQTTQAIAQILVISHIPPVKINATVAMMLFSINVKLISLNVL